MFVLEFPVGWYPYLFFWLLVWLLLPPWKKDYRGTLMFGAVGTVLGAGVETLAVFMGLWSYTGGNWPVLLWPAYFIASMVWYQLFKFTEYFKSSGLFRSASEDAGQGL